MSTVSSYHQFFYLAYSYDDTSGDTSLSDFSISKAPSYVFTVLQDILKVNPSVRVHLLPWSPPGWMKNGSHTMDGGSLESQYETDCKPLYFRPFNDHVRLMTDNYVKTPTTSSSAFKASSQSLFPSSPSGSRTSHRTTTPHIRLL